MADCRYCIHHDVCDAHGKLLLIVGEFCELEYIPKVDKWCKHFAPTADVAPRAEVEALQEVNADLNESLRLAAEANKDLQAAVDRLRFNLKAVLDERAEDKAEVAREILREIEQEINAALQSNYKVLPQIEQSESLWNRVSGKIDALRGIDGFIAELEEKYTGESQ